MICPRNDCKLSFNKPLELFNGKWFCPHCRENIFPDEDTVLEITAENHVKLVNSDQIFYRYYLLNEDKDEKEKRHASLKEAMRLCSESAFLNNPYALVNMGFYYENNYIDLHRSVAERLRVAYLYYNAICFNKTKRISLPNNSKSDEKFLADKEFNKLKERAALNLYSLLNKIPLHQEKMILGNTVNINEKLNSINDLFKQLGVDNPDRMIIEKTDDSITADMLLAIMCQNQIMNRSPLFGLFRLTKEDIVKLNDKTYKNKNGMTKSVSDHILDNKIKIKIAKALSLNEARELKEIKNANEINGLVSNEESNALFFLFFYNNECNTPYFKKKEIRKIYDTLTKNSDEILMMYINKGLVNSYVFGADDIYKFIKKKNDYGEAIKKLYKYCTSD